MYKNEKMHVQSVQNYFIFIVKYANLRVLVAVAIVIRELK